jgi:HK97 family phage portal protein
MGIIKEIIDSAVLKYSKKNNLSLDSNVGWTSLTDIIGNSNEVLKEDYRSFVYSCINTRAEKVRESELCLYQNQASGNKKEIEKHPFIDLTQSTNLYNQSFGVIKYLIAANLDLFGNAYLYIIRNRFGIPTQLICLPSKYVYVIYDSAMTQIESYRYSNGSKLINYLPAEILHIKLPNPYNMLVGKSTVSAIRSAINTDWYQSIYNENFYMNDASIGMTLEFPEKLSVETYDRVTNQLKEKYSGYQKAGKNLILEGGGKASRINATPKEANFIQSRLNLRDEIFGVFKVSKSIMGYTDDVNRANADSQKAAFIQNVIAPFAENISDAFTTFVKINYDERLYVENDFDLQKDSGELRQDLDLMMKYDAMDKNELREAFGYTAKPEYDNSNNNDSENQNINNGN